MIYTKNDLLKMSAARLYSLGIDVEGAREELKRLVSMGISFESREMIEALNNFQELDAQWKSLEEEHLKLKDEIKKLNKIV